MLSFQSLIFTIVAVIAIWRGFSLLSKFTEGRRTSPTRPKPRRDSPRQADGEQSIELVPCQRCGAYIDPREGCRCKAGS